MVEIDWYAWHRLYDRPNSKRAARLSQMQDLILRALDEQQGARVNVLSVCAGQARELLGAVERFTRPGDVHAHLIELDPRNVEYAERALREEGVGGVRTTVGDAGLRSHYEGIAPPDILLLCGVFGNLTQPDIERTIGLAQAIVRPGGIVVWTRHRNEPDCVPQIESWFASHGFTEIHSSDPGDPVAITAHRLTGEGAPLPAENRVFTFIVGVAAA
jgi:hypothetical protein